MKRTLHAVLLAALAFFVFNEYQRKTASIDEFQATPDQVEWLNKRLRLEAYIRDLESKLYALKARYEAIPEGDAYHTPWSSASDLRRFLSEVEQDPRFKKSCKCEKISSETKVFCRDWQRAKKDQARWFALAKLSVEINAVMYSLQEARIEAGLMGENIPEAKRQLMTYMRRA